MIDLMIKNICRNSDRINKIDKRTCLQFLMVAITIHIMTAAIDKHEKKINELEKELKEMKSKGE